MTIVPPKEEEREDSWGAEAETLARGDRTVWRYSVQGFDCSSVWKIHSCHYFLRQKPSLYIPMVRMRPFLYVLKCGPARGYVDRSYTEV